MIGVQKRKLSQTTATTCNNDTAPQQAKVTSNISLHNEQQQQSIQSIRPLAVQAATTGNKRKRAKLATKSNNNKMLAVEQLRSDLNEQKQQAVAAAVAAANGNNNNNNNNPNANNGDESVWIFGLINNIEQLLSTFTAINQSGSPHSGSVSGTMTPSSTNSSSCSSQASSPAQPANSAITTANTLLPTGTLVSSSNHHHHKQQLHHQHHQTISSTPSTITAHLPRSPISRQIKFHEYKGPPSVKRQQQQQQAAAPPPPPPTSSSSSSSLSSVRQITTNSNATTSFPTSAQTTSQIQTNISQSGAPRGKDKSPMASQLHGTKRPASSTIKCVGSNHAQSVNNCLKNNTPPTTQQTGSIQVLATNNNNSISNATEQARQQQLINSKQQSLSDRDFRHAEQAPPSQRIIHQQHIAANPKTSQQQMQQHIVQQQQLAPIDNLLTSVPQNHHNHHPAFTYTNRTATTTTTNANGSFSQNSRILFNVEAQSLLSSTSSGQATAFVGNSSVLLQTDDQQHLDNKKPANADIDGDKLILSGANNDNNNNSSSILTNPNNSIVRISTNNLNQQQGQVFDNKEVLIQSMPAVENVNYVEQHSDFSDNNFCNNYIQQQSINDCYVGFSNSMTIKSELLNENVIHQSFKQTRMIDNIQSTEQDLQNHQQHNEDQLYSVNSLSQSWTNTIDDDSLATTVLGPPTNQSISRFQSSSQSEDDNSLEDNTVEEIQPSIGNSFFQGFDELLFSEYIDLQDVPMNVDESDWLKKFLPPCSMN